MTSRRWTIARPSYLKEGHPPLLAVDPGKVSGLAFLDSAGEGFLAEEAYLRALNTCERVVTEHADRGLCIVTERFRITPKTARNTQAPWSLKSNGMLEWIAAKHRLTYTEQSPADAKRGAPRERLKHAGWYVSTPDGHAKDAASHLYVRFVQMLYLSPPLYTELPD